MCYWNIWNREKYIENYKKQSNKYRPNKNHEKLGSAVLFFTFFIGSENLSFAKSITAIFNDNVVFLVDVNYFYYSGVETN